MKYRRGQIKYYYDILKHSPNKVTKIIMLGNVNYRQLEKAHDAGLIIFPRLGRKHHNQIIRRTEKGEKYFQLMKEIISMLDL